ERAPVLGPCGGEQAVMGLRRLVAVVEAMDAAVGECEDGYVVKPDCRDAMAVEIERSDGRHQAWQASNVRFRRSASSSRPMKTRRLSCFSPSFQARWWSPSRIMCTPCTT